MAGGYDPENTDPGADLDKDLDENWDDQPDQTPAAAPTPAPVARPTAPAAQQGQWSAPAFTVGGGNAGANQWSGPAFSIAPAKPAAAKPGLGVELMKGAARVGADVMGTINEAANWVTERYGQKVYEDTGDTSVLGTALTDKTAIATERSRLEDELKPSVSSVSDIGSGHDAAVYGAGQLGTAVASLAEYAALGIPRAVMLGAVEGGLKAAKENNGDPRAVATGAAVQAVANGIPAKFLGTATGKTFLASVTKSALGMAGFNVAMTGGADQLPAMAAGQPYQARSAQQYADAVASGLIAGGVFGAHGHIAHGGETSQAQPDASAPLIADDHRAALQQALLPAPEPRPGITYQPDRAQGDGFTAGQPQPMDTATGQPLRPSDGVGRTEMVVQLAQQPDLGEKLALVLPLKPGGPSPNNPVHALRRMTTPDIATLYDKAFPDRARIPDTVEPQQTALPPPATEMPDQSGDTLTKPAIEPQQLLLEKPSIALPDQTHPVDLAAAEAEPPTPAQAEAGNYPKGHVRIQGLDVSIETPEGGIRKGPVDNATGEPAWQAEMPGHYGYIRGTLGADGDQLDVTLGPRIKDVHDAAPDRAAGDPVFIIDQVDPATGKFDEHKIFLGFHTDMEATRAYDASFSDGSGPSRRGAITEMPLSEFKDWAASGNTKQPLGKPMTVGARLRAQQKARMTPQAAPERAPVHIEPASAEPEPMVVGLVKRADIAKPRVSRMASEAATESREQPSVYEHETAGPTTVVEEPGVEKQRSSLTTNKDRLLGDLEQKVNDGLLTPVEAAKEYGVKEPGTGGRARKHADFAAYLKSRIAEAEDPQRQQEILDRAGRLQNDRTLTGDKRKAAVRALNNEIQRTGPEYSEKLREMLRGVEDPEGAEADRQQRQASALDTIRRLTKNPSSWTIDTSTGEHHNTLSPTEQLVGTPRINAPVHDILQESDRNRAPVGVHRYLDAIINDPVLRVRMPQAVALARRLKFALPKDLLVMSQQTAADRTGDSEHVNDVRAGRYHYDEDHIVLNPTARAEGLVTLLHEATHAVTHRFLLSAQREGNPAATHSIAVLREIREELLAAMQARRLSPDEQHLIGYATTNVAELHTMLMTDPTVQRFAAEHTPSPEFGDNMRRLGYTGQETRSVWQAFTHWVRRVVGLPPASNTFLDQIMRPLQDVMDRGAAYRENDVRIADPIVRAMAEPVLDRFPELPRFDRDGAREQLGRTLDRIDPKGLGDRARRVILQDVPTDQMVKWNRELFDSRDPQMPGNALENWRNATEAQAAASTATRLRFADRVNGLAQRLRASTERDAIANLANDATLADVRLGPGADNSHVSGRDQVDALNTLSRRYSALSPEGRKIYNDLRDYYRETYSRERRAQLTSMVRTALPDASSADVETIVKQVRTMRGINELINDPDKTPVAAAFADKWTTSRALVKLVAQAHRQGVVQGDYFPLRRFGDYVIHYGTKGTGDYGVEMFERRSQAEARRDELVKQDVEPSQVDTKRQSHLHELLPTTVVDQLDTAIRHAPELRDHADQVRDLFSSIMLQHATRSEAARSRQRRQGIKGASTEIERTLAQDFLSLTSRMGYLEHGPDRVQAMSAMQRHTDWLGRNGAPGEAIAARAVVAELQKRAVADDNSGFLSGVSRKFTNMGFLYSMLRPALMIVHTADAHSNASSLLGARHGYGRATLALGKALRDASPTALKTGAVNSMKAVRGELQAVDWHIADLVRDRLIAKGAGKGAMTDLFKRLSQASLIDHTQVREVQRMAHPTPDISRGWWDRSMNFIAASQHAVDVLNKAAIAKAAYDLELTKSGSHEKAASYAVNMARDSMPNYNLHNKPRIATSKGVFGQMAGPVMQLKLYGLHEYSLMANLVKQSMHGASRADRMEAGKAFAGIIATHALLAGAVSNLMIDPIKWVLGAYDWATGATKPHNYENDVRNWISDAFGPGVGEIVARGVTHLAGVDMHNSLKLSNMLELPEIESFDSKGLLTSIASAMTGVAGEDATAIAGGMRKLLDGDMSGLQALMPRTVRDVAGAYSMATKGIVDSRGRTELAPGKIGTGTVVAKALGFQPAQISEFREGRGAVLEAKEEMASARTKAITGFVTASGGSSTQDALARVHDFNQAHPAEKITYSQLYEAKKKAVEGVRTPGSYGVTVPKKGARQITEEGRFGAH